LPPGRARLSTSPSTTGSDPAPQKNDGDCFSGVLGGARVIGPGRDDHVDLETHQLISQDGEPVVLSIGESMDKSHVLAIDITEFPELSLERFVPRSGTGTRSKKTNLRYFYRLLGMSHSPTRYEGDNESNKLHPFSFLDFRILD
jgi:hypothetical protein